MYSSLDRDVLGDMGLLGLWGLHSLGLILKEGPFKGGFCIGYISGFRGLRGFKKKVHYG